MGEGAGGLAVAVEAAVTAAWAVEVLEAEGRVEAAAAGAGSGAQEAAEEGKGGSAVLEVVVRPSTAFGPEPARPHVERATAHPSSPRGSRHGGILHLRLKCARTAEAQCTATRASHSLPL